MEKKNFVLAHTYWQWIQFLEKNNYSTKDYTRLLNVNQLYGLKNIIIHTLPDWQRRFSHSSCAKILEVIKYLMEEKRLKIIQHKEQFFA
jgi:hypothetical protein